jgi:environmental stress-induced protein Ves
MNIVRTLQVDPEAWANGGGLTRTLLAWPDPREWWLRISVADVERAGPFSVFPGVDRWFAVLEGDGVCLRSSGRPPAVVRANEEGMHNFPGDATTDCDLQGDATRDLNVMVRRRDARATIRPLRSGALRSNAELLGCFVCADATLEVDGTAIDLPRHALAWFDNAVRRARAWDVAAPVPRGWWVETSRIPGDAMHGG